MSFKGADINLKSWKEVKELMEYTDDNDGYHHGVEFVNDELDAQWFKTESEMYQFINGNELKIQKEIVHT